MIIRLSTRRGREERNRLSGIASHTTRISELEDQLIEALAWEAEHDPKREGIYKLFAGHRSGILQREIDHSKAMLAMYQDKARYARSRRRGVLS